MPRTPSWSRLSIVVIHLFQTLFFSLSVGPRNIVFRPKREVFTIGDQVTCCADGNPGPVYEWKELETGFTTSGAVLTVEKTKPSYKAIYQFKCTARNNFSITDDVLIFTIEGRPTVSRMHWVYHHYLHSWKYTRSRIIDILLIINKC